MLMPSSPLRRRLRGEGHHLAPVVQVGKEGVSAAVVRQLDQALGDHELVKVKVGSETPEDRFEAAERLGAGTGAGVAQVLGRTVLLYRKHPEKPRFEAPDPSPFGEPVRPGPRPKPGPKSRSGPRSKSGSRPKPRSGSVLRSGSGSVSRSGGRPGSRPGSRPKPKSRPGPRS
jgi:RNA-binding protein